MKKLDWYMLKELTVPFLIGTVAVLLMFQANQFIYLFKSVSLQNVPFSAFAQLVLYKTPYWANMTLPVGMSLAASLAMSRITRESELTAIRAANVEAIFLPGYYTEAALIVRQARDLGLAVPFFGGDGWESEKLLEIGGEALNGCYYSTHFSPENNDPAVIEFAKRYKARWNGETPGAFSASV